MTAAEQRAIPVRGYATNTEFLEAKFKEVALQLECAGLRRLLGQRSLRRWCTGLRSESEETIPTENLQHQLEISEQERLRHRAVIEARLQASAPSVVPFLDLVERCGVTAFDRQVLWLLFFKAVSPESRDHYRQLGVETRRTEGEHEVCIGDLLEILCSSGIGGTMQARARFRIDAPLMAHHLVRMDHFREERPSILDIGVHLPQRIVSWISGDTHRYPSDSPCLVEWPTEDVNRVVLDNGVVQRLLGMVDHYEEFRARRSELGLADGASCGSTLVILEHGPPGTGKTLLARALACRAGKPLVSLLTKGHYRASDAELEYLFREARLQDGILFINECESLCSEDSDELRVLLRELEHFDGIVIMATNRSQVLVPQFDRRCTVKVPFALPSEQARLRIWQLHLGSTPLAADVNLARLAQGYPIAGGYIKNAAQTAVNEALAREGELILRQADLEAACRLQEQHVGSGLEHGLRYRPQPRINDLVTGEKLRARLWSLALALTKQRDILRSWLGEGCPEAGGVRVLFHGKDFHAAMAAADAVAGEMERRVLRLWMRELKEDWALEVIEAAANTGQIVAIADPWGRLGNGQADEGEILRDVVAECSHSSAILFVVSGEPLRGVKGWAQRFHEAVDVTPADADGRAHQWRRLLGGRADGIDVERLAEEFPATVAQMRMALERAALRTGAVGKVELREEELWEAVRGVVGDREGGLFG